MILVAVFGTGYLVIVADIIRVAFLQNTAKAQLKELHSFYTADISNYNHTCQLVLPTPFIIMLTENYS